MNTNRPVFLPVVSNSSPGNASGIDNTNSFNDSVASDASFRWSEGTVQSEAARLPHQDNNSSITSTQYCSPHHTVSSVYIGAYNGFLPISNRSKYSTANMRDYGFNTNVSTPNYSPIATQTQRSIFNGLHHQNSNKHIGSPSAFVRPTVHSRIRNIGSQNNWQSILHKRAAHSTIGIRRIRNRTAFNTHQLMILEKEYNRAKYIEKCRRLELAQELFVDDRVIKVWFQNRRMRDKKDDDAKEEETAVNDSSFSPAAIVNVQHQPLSYAANHNRVAYQPVQIVIRYPQYIQPVQNVMVNTTTPYPGMMPQSNYAHLPYQMPNHPSYYQHQNLSNLQIQTETKSAIKEERNNQEIVVDSKYFVDNTRSASETNADNNLVQNSMKTDAKNNIVLHNQEALEESKYSIDISNSDDRIITSTECNTERIDADIKNNLVLNSQKTMVVSKPFVNSTISDDNNTSSEPKNLINNSIKTDVEYKIEPKSIRSRLVFEDDEF